MKTICGYSVDEYIHMIEKFHGSVAPGVLIGGLMVDILWTRRDKEKFYDFLCETAVCLPDAIQLLTPCTYGNGWLKVIHTGRFAMTMFEKYHGDGTRAYLDTMKLKQYNEITNWFFKLKPKEAQNKELLIHQIIDAWDDIISVQKVKVCQNYIGKDKLGAVGVCPRCGEAYPLKDGKLCRVCNGLKLYE
ncbi:MAG: formylmethanofuran dehydrogenase subunit E family protein [Spirochaetes bacterium]|nr:formylmethanofuran dehydrogenase subunit E family protein [Spirochaetota bacterium]